MIPLYEKFSGKDLEIAQRIQQRRYQILVHSCIYYKFGENIVSDATWSKWAVELERLQEEYSYIAMEVELDDVYKGFTAGTGAFLPIDEDWVISKAQRFIQKARGVNITYRPIKVEKPKPKQKTQATRLF